MKCFVLYRMGSFQSSSLSQNMNSPLVWLSIWRIVMAGFTCGYGGSHLPMGSSNESFPSSASWSVNAATMFLVILPIANAISGLMSAPGWEIPAAPRQTVPSVKTTAADAPFTAQRRRRASKAVWSLSLRGRLVKLHETTVLISSIPTNNSVRVVIIDHHRQHLKTTGRGPLVSSTPRIRKEDSPGHPVPAGP